MILSNDQFVKLLYDFMSFSRLIGIYISEFHSAFIHDLNYPTERVKMKTGGEGAVLLTWPPAGSRPPEAVGAVCLLRPLGPEPLPHLPPECTHTLVLFLLTYNNKWLLQ